MAKSILFVCMGNICRSPAAEGVMRRLIAERGLEEVVRVDSAGTLDHHAGNPADSRMIEAAERRGYRLDSRARAVTEDDFHSFDLIVCMDADNFANLEQEARLSQLEVVETGQLRMLGSYLPDADPDNAADDHDPVPDPYYGNADGFDRVLNMLEDAMPNVLADALGEDADEETA